MPGFQASRIITKDELCLMEKIPQACGLVIFGASGDLSHRKLFPALLTLLRDNVLPASCYVLGVSRTPMTDDAFRAGIQGALPTEFPAPLVDAFLKRCFYIAGDYASANTYIGLRDRLVALDAQFNTGGRHLFYLSIPPSVYSTVSAQLGTAGLAREESQDRWSRIVVEKPFGTSLASAQQLSHSMHAQFRERQIYRIDHYLGKETVQNMLMFRFANAIFEPVWNHRYIDHVQITAAEADGVGHRAGYYEQAGALRDMFQNHLFQLLSLVAMEPPASFAPDAIRDEKSKVMASLSPLSTENLNQHVVRGQYQGYRQEKGVLSDSTTETFAALRLEIDNWRWQHVPFYLRSGKCLAARETEIAIQFRHVPTSIFKPLMAEQMAPNILRFRIQPNEGISLCFEAKHPGPKLCISTVTMQFDYSDAFGTEPPEPYARLFLDVMLGDQTLFSRQDWLAHSWRVLDPLLDYWKEQRGNGLSFYAPQSRGPEAADAMLHREGRSWMF